MDYLEISGSGINHWATKCHVLSHNCDPAWDGGRHLCHYTVSMVAVPQTTGQTRLSLWPYDVRNVLLIDMFSQTRLSLSPDDVCNVLLIDMFSQTRLSLSPDDVCNVLLIDMFSQARNNMLISLRSQNKLSNQLITPWSLNPRLMRGWSHSSWHLGDG